MSVFQLDTQAALLRHHWDRKERRSHSESQKLPLAWSISFPAVLEDLATLSPHAVDAVRQEPLGPSQRFRRLMVNNGPSRISAGILRATSMASVFPHQFIDSSLFFGCRFAIVARNRLFLALGPGFSVDGPFFPCSGSLTFCSGGGVGGARAAGAAAAGFGDGELAAALGGGAAIRGVGDGVEAEAAARGSAGNHLSLGRHFLGTGGRTQLSRPFAVAFGHRILEDHATNLILFAKLFQPPADKNAGPSSGPEDIVSVPSAPIHDQARIAQDITAH